MKYPNLPRSYTLIFFCLVTGLFPVLSTVAAAQDTKTEEPPRFEVAEPRAFRIGAEDQKEDDNGVRAVVRGRVVYADSGRPVRRAEVGLTRTDNYDSSTRKTLTNSNGEFEITRVKPGSYLPYIKIPGVLNEGGYNYRARQMKNGKEEQPPSGQIVVTGPEEVSVLIEAKRGAAISGKVSYFDGEPAVGMRVEVLKQNDRSYEKTGNSSDEFPDVGTAATDDRGMYRFSGLPEGTYIVRVIEKADHAPVRSDHDYYSPSDNKSELKTYYPNVTTVREAKPVEVVLGQETGEIDLLIPDRKIFSIGGTVVAKSDKRPLKGFNVSISKLREGESSVVADYESPLSENTGTRGEWNFVDLPPGKYLIHARPYYQYEREPGPDVKDAKKTNSELKFAPVFKVFTIDANDLKEVVFEIPFEATISGTVVMENGKPLPESVSVVAFDPKTEASSSDFVMTRREKEPAGAPVKKADFSISGLRDGVFTVVVLSGDVYIKEIRSAGTVVGDRKFELKEGQQLGNVEIVLGADFGTLKGKVNNFDRNFHTNVIAFSGKDILESLSSVRQGNVKEDGNFEMKLPPGEYSVFVISEKNSFDPKKESREEFLKRLARNHSSVSIKVNETAEVTVDLGDQ